LYQSHILACGNFALAEDSPAEKQWNLTPRSISHYEQLHFLQTRFAKREELAENL
jgi:hypothetical protein